MDFDAGSGVLSHGVRVIRLRVPWDGQVVRSGIAEGCPEATVAAATFTR